MSEKIKQKITVFSDGSFDPNKKVGVGCYLQVDGDFPIDPMCIPQQFRTKEFLETSPARLEIQTALWALAEIAGATDNIRDIEIILVTDSKTIEGLPKRRQKLELSGYISSRQKLELSNADLYKEFFKIHDETNLSVVWVKGHVRSGSYLETVFSFVDRYARKKLREV